MPRRENPLTRAAKVALGIGGVFAALGAVVLVTKKTTAAATPAAPTGAPNPIIEHGGVHHTGNVGIPFFLTAHPCIDLAVYSPVTLNWNLPDGSVLGAIATYGGAKQGTGPGDVPIAFDGTSAAVTVDWTDASGNAQRTTIVNNGQVINLDAGGAQQNVTVTSRKFFRVQAPAGALATYDLSGFSNGVNRVLGNLAQQHDSFNAPIGSCVILSIDGAGSVNVGFTMPSGYVTNKISANGG